MNKTVRLTLVISLILNVLLGGVLLGALPHRWSRESFHRHRFEAAAEHLPEPARSRFRSRIEEVRAQAQPLRDEMERARDEALRAFSAEPFDTATFDRQVQRITELRLKLSNHFAASMKQIAAELPSEQRQALAEALTRPERSRMAP